MIKFVDIEKEEFYSFESWDEIISKGGLKTLFSERENLYEEKAVRETVGSVMGISLIALSTEKTPKQIPVYSKNTYMSLDKAMEFIQPYLRAAKLFKTNSGLI